MSPRLIAITGGGPDVVARLRAVLDAGAPGALVREDAVPAGLPDDPRLILHARMPGAEALATAHGWGLHLPGAADVAEVRARFSGPLGYSAHSPAEADAALAAGADWAFLSPIWAPASKPGDARPPLGPAALGPRRYALGGVAPGRVAACLDAGAAGVAVLGGIWGAEDPAGAVRAYLAAIRACEGRA